MSWLSCLLIIKISVTFFLVALPFLFFPRSRLEQVTDVSATSTLFFRLYGVAILALLVGYAFGIPLAESGHFPRGVVCMGLVSNSGAAILLFRIGKGLQNLVMAPFFTLITIGLVISLALPEVVLQKAW